MLGNREEGEENGVEYGYEKRSAGNRRVQGLDVPNRQVGRARKVLSKAVDTQTIFSGRLPRPISPLPAQRHSYGRILRDWLELIRS